MAIRTRCKFKVVGVEEVEHAISTRVYEGTPEFDAATEAHVWEEHLPNPERRLGGERPVRKYKSIPTGKNATNVRLAAQYDPSNPEDVSFAEATPSGEVKIYVSNPAVVGTFKVGTNYYMDLIPVE